MYRIATASVLALYLMVFPRGAFAAQTEKTLAIDATASKVQLSIQHIFVQHVLGTVPVLSGEVKIPVDSPVPSSVTATLDATKVRTDDPDQTKCSEAPTTSMSRSSGRGHFAA